MNKSTWMMKTIRRTIRTLSLLVILCSLTGCMSVPSGQPHPFATMFRDYPPANTQHVMETAEIRSARVEMAAIR